jgi:hypothetical protein
MPVLVGDEPSDEARVQAAVKLLLDRKAGFGSCSTSVGEGRSCRTTSAGWAASPQLP